MACMQQRASERAVLWHLQVERSKARLIAQFAADGSIPDEMRRPTQLHYMMFSLQGWYTLARVAVKAGECVATCALIEAFARIAVYLRRCRLKPQPMMYHVYIGWLLFVSRQGV